MLRRSCPTSLRPAILRRQKYRCLYCSLPFGSVIRKGARTVVTEVQWDHRVPFAYLQDNPADNWAAACNLCNGMKAALIFEFMDDLRAHLEQTWADKRLAVVWIPDVSSALDAARWASDFAAWLSGKTYRTSSRITPFGFAVSVSHDPTASSDTAIDLPTPPIVPRERRLPTRPVWAREDSPPCDICGAPLWTRKPGAPPHPSHLCRHCRSSYRIEAELARRDIRYPDNSRHDEVYVGNQYPRRTERVLQSMPMSITDPDGDTWIWTERDPNGRPGYRWAGGKSTTPIAGGYGLAFTRAYVEQGRYDHDRRAQ